MKSYAQICIEVIGPYRAFVAGKMRTVTSTIDRAEGTITHELIGAPGGDGR